MKVQLRIAEIGAGSGNFTKVIFRGVIIKSNLLLQEILLLNCHILLRDIYQKFADAYHTDIENIKKAVSEKVAKGDITSQKAIDFIVENAKAVKPRKTAAKKTAKKAAEKTEEAAESAEAEETAESAE